MGKNAIYFHELQQSRYNGVAVY